MIVFHVMKLHSHSISKEGIIAAMEDNSGETGLVQTKIADEAMQLSSGEVILEKFLNTTARIERIILFTKRVCDDSTFATVVALGNKMKTEGSQDILEICHNRYHYQHQHFRQL